MQSESGLGDCEVSVYEVMVVHVARMHSCWLCDDFVRAGVAVALWKSPSHDEVVDNQSGRRCAMV